jgi:type I restriction-modification system DNA methylase subunit
MTEAEKNIIKRVERLAGKYNPYNIFNDWITMLGLSIANACTAIHGKIYNEREEWYMSVKNKYTEAEFDAFAEMTAYLVESLEEEMTDVLGGVFMLSGAGNDRLGQFFTPFHLSELNARIALDKMDLTEEKLKINEPSSGGGGMIIAVAKVLREMGIDYQKKMEVVAQDLDWNGVFMSYVQFSLLGIDAIVVQGDTLIEPYVKGYPEGRVLRTPRNRGALI